MHTARYCDVKCFKTLLQFAMFVRNSSVTTATVFLVTTCAMDIVHALMEATKETVVSVHGNTISRSVARITGDDSSQQMSHQFSKP